MKRVLLFACIEKNIGDDLFIYTVCNRYPNVKFIISSDANYGTLKDIKNLKFSKILKYWNICNDINKSKKVKFIFGKIVKKVFFFYLHRYKYGVYIVGNAFKNINYNGSSDIEWLANRRDLVKEFFLLSTNFGPFNNKLWINDCYNVFCNIQDICFRDTYSYMYFKNLPNVRWAPDSVLSLEKGITFNKEQNIVLISLIDLSYPSRDKKLLNCRIMYENLIVSIIKYFSNKQYEIQILNFNTEQDINAANRIIEKCKKCEIKVTNYHGNLQEVFEIYSKVKYVIGTRLHSIILSWLYKKPVIPIIYDLKVKEMLRSYKFNNFTIDIENLNNLNTIDFEDIMNNYEFDNLDNLLKESNMQFFELDQRLKDNGYGNE